MRLQSSTFKQESSVNMNRPKLTSRDDAGLRRMARAVLLQALEDLNEGDEATRVEAWQWLSGENEAGLSFELCCRMVGCRPEVVRRNILPSYADVDAVVAAARTPAPALELVEQFA